MELCAAALGVEPREVIKTQLDIDSGSSRYYTDSYVVLGYITNTDNRFYVYVMNRLNRIFLARAMGLFSNQEQSRRYGYTTSQC